MEMQEFNELAGRIEGVARAVLILAEMMERETCMDGPTLTHHWRESFPQQDGAGILDTARRTLHVMAQQLDDARTRRQESVAAVRRANPDLLRAAQAPR